MTTANHENNMKDGKQLEGLVAFVEQNLLPQGFEVKTNERVFNEEGIQIAEFDVEIRGKLGSTAIAWLIECRDRPCSGPAPASWIEQLVGRRDHFGFNKVTAVSTTGFAVGALEYAKRAGIELREVKSVTPEEFRWIVCKEITLVRQAAELSSAQLMIDESEVQDRRDALNRVVAAALNETPILKSIKTGAVVSAPVAFLGAVEREGNLFDGLEENGPGRRVHLYAIYPDADHYVVDTDLGPIRIRAIDFQGELRIERSGMPLSMTNRYEHISDGSVISQVAAFTPIDLQGAHYSLELHRMGEDGEIHILIRCIGKDS
jgi:hypothetical protein